MGCIKTATRKSAVREPKQSARFGAVTMKDIKGAIFLDELT
jgi:hypothetical protein